MRCDSCGAKEIYSVRFEAARGAIYTYCRRCETGRWTAGDVELEVEKVLEAASEIPPARRAV